MSAGNMYYLSGCITGIVFEVNVTYALAAAKASSRALIFIIKSFVVSTSCFNKCNLYYEELILFCYLRKFLLLFMLETFGLFDLQV